LCPLLDSPVRISSGSRPLAPLQIAVEVAEEGGGSERGRCPRKRMHGRVSRQQRFLRE